jgi:DNA-binding NarL/FixJ family response regulator
MLEPNAGQPPGLGPIRVLIVDDQEAFRSAARLVVEMTDGFETVGEAADGATALELARTLDPQVVLLDMRLPVIDGVEVTRRLSRDHPAIRVLALSVHDEYERRALGAGAVAFVTKAAFGPDAVLAAWRRSGGPRAPERRGPQRDDAPDGG